MVHGVFPQNGDDGGGGGGGGGGEGCCDVWCSFDTFNIECSPEDEKKTENIL